MRRILTPLLAVGVTLLAASPGRAQTADRKTAISLFGTANQYKGSFGDNFWHWNRNDYGYGIGLNRYLSRGLDLGLQGSYVELNGNRNTNTYFSTNVVTVNLALKLKLNNGWALKEDAFIQPYLLVAPGIAYTSAEGQTEGATLNTNKTYFDAHGAAGINFRITEGIGLFVQTGLHLPWGASFDGIPNPDDNKIDDRFLQHSAGLTFAFGKPKDTDGDGVPDRKDKCPATPAGVAVDPSGCPLDKDGDGVPDYQDKCPDQAGTAALEGCPDRDGDGVRDADDACPDQAGTAALRGCPDADADGIPDNVDKCPNTPAGTRVDATGCPAVVDQDNDGVLDPRDRCPDTPAGTRVDSVGCPLAVDPNLQKLQVPIGFRTNSTIIERRSYPTANRIAQAMKTHPDYQLRIIGHADSRGTEEYNQGLSERRAEAVKRYFTNKGVEPARVITEGRGETEPVAPNTTKAGQARNRRVEFRFEYIPTTPAPAPQP